ncbi:MAG: hypothetical protein GC145_06115 [Caulobacter sp.]|nr:hypothetical protein [Caulobacter sp.]
MATMDANPKAMVVEPRPVRPALDDWMVKNRITNERFAEAVGVSREAVRKWRLPFGDINRLTPGKSSMEKIHAVTQRMITPADFYPPELSGPPADAGEARP